MGVINEQMRPFRPHPIPFPREAELIRRKAGTVNVVSRSLRFGYLFD